MNSVIGVDLGSRTTKIVFRKNGKVIHKELFDTGHDPLARVMQSIKRIGKYPIIATGYGRFLVSDNLKAKRVTEIKACAKGAFALNPNCRTILDVGGQDCKVIHIDDKGRVIDFEMNDRCAAGTGKFLEVMAQTFEMNIDSFVQIALEAKESIKINSMCTVFAESEVVSLITSGKAKEKIALGLHASVASRLQAMLTQMQSKDEIMFVGGGALNNCLHRLLEQGLKRRLMRAAEPQIITALGATLLEPNYKFDITEPI
jgi:predicted CoA-substrate-specific enzyme activase